MKNGFPQNFRSRRIFQSADTELEQVKSEDVCLGPRFRQRPRTLFLQRKQVLGMIRFQTHSDTGTRTRSLREANHINRGPCLQALIRGLPLSVYKIFRTPSKCTITN